MKQSDYLEFEKPIAEFQHKIEEIKLIQETQGLNLSDEIRRLEEKSRTVTEQLFSHLTSWQVAQVARHIRRPHTKDYIDKICTDFDELKGDRFFADDPALIGGLAYFNGMPVMVLGHQKGREVREKVLRNFGMPRPEGYRKALRLMQMAERFNLPILSFVDTPGAYPGIDAEERGQSEAIARNIQAMSTLSVPIIVTVIGEGGSGGALAIGVGDWVQMLKFSTYSVISPEGCASILWKSAEKAPEAAEAMKLTADRLFQLGLVDGIVDEPLGGAHRDWDLAASFVKNSIRFRLKELLSIDRARLIEMRYQRLMSHGAHTTDANL